MLWTQPIAVFALMSLSVPYSDTQGRFRLEFDDAWKLAPRFGDTRGMVFARTGPSVESHRVQFEVRVEGAEAANPAARVARFILDKAGRDGVFAERTQVGAHDARWASAEYEIGPRGDARVVTAWALTVDDIAYLLVFDRPRFEANRYRTEIQRMLRSFVPTAKPAPAPVEPVRAKSPPPPTTDRAASLVGRWRSSEGVELAFSADGRFIIGDLYGRYVLLDANALELERPDGTKERFAYVARDGRLTLRSERLSKPVVYVRQAEGSGGPKGSADRDGAAAASSDSPPLSAERLTGTWRALAEKVELVLRLAANGEFTLGPYTGSWTIKGNHLRLAKSPQEAVTYTVRLTKGVLWLSGGDLDGRVAFVREGK